MKRQYKRIATLATSATARDTYVLFIGNLVSAFFSFLFTLLIARGLSVSDFGVFSAAVNLVTIIASLSDLGISSGLISFIAKASRKGDVLKAQKYMKASLVVRLIALSVLVLITVLFAPFISNSFLATRDATVAYWVGGLSLAFLFWALFPSILQAQKRFLQSVVVDLSLAGGRLLLAFGFFMLGGLTLTKAFVAFTLSTFFVILAGFAFLGTSFLLVRVEKDVYSKLLRFSGWLGVNRVISSVSGRLDVQMLAAMAGATMTGFYSISSRLAMFIVLLTSSFSAVLAPRLASFGNKESEKTYIKKASLAIVPVIFGVILWIAIAEPFIAILFGQKYLPSVPVFRALAASMIPFLLTAPAVPAIIYAMKKPIYIGVFSFFQIFTVFIINLILIPKIGVYAPTVAFGLVNTILAVYVWTIVIRYYRTSPKT
ncbi:oligosaccharide flippase family protein [Patescibacteria group bacterium]|nr:oligosaccharide flippase family protein [Patescibacteria group bacterium]MBU0777379.1 oligosaccharide flippase family protein [Patescibacteria group bacterium]MBU0845647.1 oligosaccharide flippase family protein [Patescibacteria group bacterium]MBU0923072.1 oligosaccharide flippase family protein [Patescibacteria group bacterium]MBU1066511.1 oligosaccharide flippase family protein [Patescibacteria group bacterium]